MTPASPTGRPPADVAGQDIVTIADLQQQLAAASARAAAARARADDLAAEYRSTADGLAESLRAIEMCTDRSRQRALTRLHIAAERAAVEEFNQRRHWGVRAKGIPRPLPCGSNPAVTKLVLQHRLHGFVRVHPDTAARKVVLFLTSPSNAPRPRRQFTIGPDDRCDCLGDAIALCADSHPDRLRKLVGVSVAAQLTTALGSRAKDCDHVPG